MSDIIKITLESITKKNYFNNIIILHVKLLEKLFSNLLRIYSASIKITLFLWPGSIHL